VLKSLDIEPEDIEPEDREPEDRETVITFSGTYSLDSRLRAQNLFTGFQ
jgi:hypothetical protein